ncbi:MAG: response regulator [Candidatus Aureabacteria bacterium]|nr:response regulator [Candidatus Auribacterota bacterium]
MKIRVLVVDDSLLFRSVLSNSLKSDPEIEVVGTAMNGKAALSAIPNFHPHVITLDLEMPELNGIETLKIIKKTYPEIQVIMVSSLTSEGADITLNGLQLGAADFILKVGGDAPAAKNITGIKSVLISKIKRAYRSGLISSQFKMVRAPIMEKRKVLETARSLILPGSTPLFLSLCCEEKHLGNVLLMIRQISQKINTSMFFKILVPELFLDSLIASFERNNPFFRYKLALKETDWFRNTVYLVGETHQIDISAVGKILKVSVEQKKEKISLDDFYHYFLTVKLPNTPFFLITDEAGTDGIKGLTALTEAGIPTVLATRTPEVFSDEAVKPANQVIELNLLPEYINKLFGCG